MTWKNRCLFLCKNLTEFFFFFLGQFKCNSRQDLFQPKLRHTSRSYVMRFVIANCRDFNVVQSISPRSLPWRFCSIDFSFSTRSNMLVPFLNLRKSSLRFRFRFEFFLAFYKKKIWWVLLRVNDYKGKSWFPL